MDAQDKALIVLNNYLALAGTDVPSSTSEIWDITQYKDAYLFSSGKGEKRSNLLCIVKGQEVKEFSPAAEKIGEVYSQFSQNCGS